jgi:hypothetical protein
MKGVTRRVLLPVLASHAVGILAILFTQIIWGDKTVLAELAWNWMFNSVLVIWIDYFIPLTITGLVLGFSVFLNSVELRTLMQGETSFVRIAGKSVVLILILSVVFVVLVGFAYGNVRQQRDSVVARSHKATAYLVEAQNFAKQGQTTEAIGAVKNALMVSPEYLAAIALQDRLSADRTTDQAAEIKNPGEKTVIEKEVPSLPSRNERLRYADLLKLAQEYLDRGDNFSALYYIRKAEEATTRVEPALVDLKTQVEKNIRGNGKSQEDAKKRQILDGKQLAIIDYLQNNRPVEAYYQLLAVEVMDNAAKGRQVTIDEVSAKLAQVLATMATKAGNVNDAVQYIYPDIHLSERDFSDPDFRRWMPEVLAQLDSNTFFREDSEALVASASGLGLMFLNSDEAGRREYVYAHAVMNGRFNLFLQSPEIIVLDKDGKVLSHRISAFGKVVGNNLIMKSLSRSQPGRVEEVRVLEGQVDTDARNAVRLYQRPEVLWNLAQSRFGYQNMSFPELVALLPLVDKAGFDALPLHSVLLGYLLQALSLPSLCFFAMGWGWANRNRYLTRPIPLVALMLVVVPFLMVGLLKIYQFLGSCLNSSLLILTGFQAAMVILIVVQAVQLAVSLIYVAGQSVD